MKSISPVKFSTLTSGLLLKICSSFLSFLSILYSVSPNPLDKFKFPKTLPSETQPPAFSILFNSAGIDGLWSTLIGTAVPLLHKTLRESPALAKYNFLS